MKVLVYTDNNSGVGIVTSLYDDYEGLTDHQCIKQNLIQGSSFEITEQDIPAKDYRNAWVAGDGEILANVEKAKVIGLVRMRIVRDKNLLALDKEESKAKRNNEDLTALHAKKDAQLAATDALKSYTHGDVNVPVSVLSTELKSLEAVPEI